MKKTVICNIPMKEVVDRSVYFSDDLSVPASDRAVCYPICAFLEKTITKEDDITVLLLIKVDEFGHYKKNKKLFEEEIMAINTPIGAKIIIKEIDTEFSQEKSVHERMMGRLIDAIEDDSHLLVDMTYGPKDLPIIIFAALGFAEHHLGCEIENIIYGQANFVNGHAVNTKICDMSPLYYLSSVANTIKCNGPEKARKTLKSLLSL